MTANSTLSAPDEQYAKLPGAEPARRGLRLDHEYDRGLEVRLGDVELLRYVYVPWDPQVESPRPYFHPLRTLRGQVVSLYRPHDHVWHKGIAWSLPNVGSENFWGGPTYRRGENYQQLPNNGAMVHRAFDRMQARADRVLVDESLDWVTQAGQTWFTEQRRFTVTVLDDDAWTLGYRTTFTNRSGTTLQLGSPTTEGRPDAGYGGLFWRGPRSFTGGTVYAPGRTGGDDLNGIRAPWLAFAGKHDADGGASTLVFVDAETNDYADRGAHTEWFVRSGVYACLSPSPYYSEELSVPDGRSLTYEYVVLIADDDRGVDGAEQLAAAGQQLLRSSWARDVPLGDDTRPDEEGGQP